MMNGGRGSGIAGIDMTAGPPPEEDGLVVWLRSVFGRIAEALPPNAVQEKIIVNLLSNRLDSSVDGVEVYEHTPGNSVEELAEEIGQRAAQDAHGIGGGVYFVTVDGIKSRFTISFEGPQSRAHASGGAAALVARGRDGGFGGGSYPFGGGGGGSYSQGPYGYARPGYGGGYDSGNPVGTFVNAMVQDKNIQLAHSERLLELAISGQTHSMQMMKSVIAEQHETLRSYERDRMKNIGTLEDLYTKKQERDLELAAALKSEERKDKAIAFVETAAQGVLGHLAQSSAAAQQAVTASQGDPLANMASSFFDSMTGDQLNALLEGGTLNDQQRFAVMQYVKLRIAQVEAEEAKNKGNVVAMKKGGR